MHLESLNISIYSRLVYTKRTSSNEQLVDSEKEKNSFAKNVVRSSL